MQKSPFILFSILIYLTVGSLGAVTHPLAGNGTHFCGVAHTQPRSDWDSKQYPNRHHARRAIANLNVGHPRTVRLIYFLPNDRPYREAVVQRMKVEIVKIQDFYAKAMNAHGYNMTFKVETDAQGDPIVHRVDGHHAEIYYIDDTSNTVRGEVEQVFDVSQNVYFIVVDSSMYRLGTGSGSMRVNANGRRIGKSGGTVLIPTQHFQQRRKTGYDKTAAHELGHAFGLRHDFRSGGYIMSYGAGRNRAPINGPDQDRLSGCSADFLSVHTYFNPDIPTEIGHPPTIEITSPNTYPSGSQNVDIQVRVTSSVGIHQVILFVESGGVGPFNLSGFYEVKDYRKLRGEWESVVNFEYDGDVPGSSFTNLSLHPIHNVYIGAIDINGDMSNRRFTISEESTGYSDNSKAALTFPEGRQEAIDSNSYQTLNLPIGAKARIGKGGAGWSNSAAAFSPTGQYLAVSSSIGIWLYNTVNYRESILLDNQYPITNIAFSPDGNTIVGGSNKNATVWNVITKKKITTFDPEGGTWRVAFSPNGKTIAYFSGVWVALWDLQTETETIKIKSEYRIGTTSFSYDGSLVAGAGRDGVISVWDTLTGQLINTFRHQAIVHSIAFSPTQNILASGSRDTTVKLWNPITGTEIYTIQNPDRVGDIAFSPDGETLAWTGITEPDTINLWDMVTQSLIAVYENSVGSNIDTIDLSPNNKNFVTVDQLFGIVKVWDIRTGDTIDLGHVDLGDNDLRHISFSPDSTIIASGGYGSVKLWDANTGKNIDNIPVEYRASVRLVSFSPDGRTLAYRVTREKFTRLWDVTTKTQTGVIHDPSVICWAFSPDGKILASAEDRVITLWDVNTKQNIATLEGHLDRVDYLTYSPNGNILASVSPRHTVRLWDMNTKQNIKTFESSGYNGFWDPPLFSPDGTMLVFSQLNVGVQVWNMVTQELTVIGQDACLTFLPNSSMMILRGFDWRSSKETFSVWDAKTKSQIATLDSTLFTLGYDLSSVSKQPIYSPDGKTLAVMGEDSVILFDPEVIYSQLPLFALSNINFVWSIPAGTSLIHVPLRVTAVDGVAHPIESIADLYDALGGANAVNYLITYDAATQTWLSYFSSSDRGSSADIALADDTGIIAGMKTAVTVQLTGDALGIGGSGTITLNQGLNLVGVPLNDNALTRVSDFLVRSGIRGNVPVITLSDGGEFKAVGRAGDPGDIPLTGGQGFILTAQRTATVTILGDAWTNDSGAGASPPITRKGIKEADTTPVLGLKGSIVDAVNQAGFRVTVKNLSTGKSYSTTTADTGYRLAVVDIETMHAARVGDLLEITAQSQSPFIGVKPLRYTVTAEDVLQSLIQLPELVAYEIPKETELLANYPNPFNPETWIPYRLAEDGFVTLTIYDQTGRVVRRIDVGHRVAAVYESRAKAIYWDGRNGLGEVVASGVYFYHLTAGNYSATRRMLILK